MTLVLNGTSGVSSVDGSASTPAIQGNDTNTGVFFPAADTVAIATGGVERVRTDASGNVGIGTSSPSSPLSVKTDTDFIVAIRTTSAGTGARIVGLNAAQNAYKDLTLDGTTVQLAVSGVEKARIDSSGNLLVGTTSGSYHTFVKSLSGNYAAGVTNSSSSAPYALNLALSGVTGGAGGGFLTCADNANRLLIAGTGNVTNSNGSYGAISDAKLKENIVDATPKLTKLNQVRIVNFNLIGESHKQLGVIAQELEQVFPGMVEDTPDRDVDGNDLGTVTKSVKYSVFVPMLIKGMQEQQALITSLTARIAALEAA